MINKSYQFVLYCSIQPLDLDKQRGTSTYKYNLMFLFFDDDASVEQESNRGDFAHTKELSGVGTTCRN